MSKWYATEVSKIPGKTFLGVDSAKDQIVDKVLPEKSVPAVLIKAIWKGGYSMKNFASPNKDFNFWETIGTETINNHRDNALKTHSQH